MTNDILDNLTHRKATLDDVKAIVDLLFNDSLGRTRENQHQILDLCYINAFHKIETDPNHYLMIVELGQEIVGTCHLTLIPSLTFQGSTRLQIEAVRVAETYRGQGIGSWMIRQAIAYGNSHGARIAQLTTNKKRSQSTTFYERLGFEVTHEGMKRPISLKQRNI